ncbi:amino acid permease [Kocuria palustris]|nr:amino acid permease [Kocuria palustris]
MFSKNEKDITVVKSAGSTTLIARLRHLFYGDISIANSRIVSYEDGKEGEEFQLKRGLKLRHVQLIAIGGAIGTGLFVGSGLTLQSGPAALFLAFVFMSLIIWCVLQIMAEMITFLPVPGNGPMAFVYDNLSPLFGFAIGWNYWYAFLMLVAAEVVAAAYVIEYWIKLVNIAVWITIILAVTLILNFTSVKFFGEAEFWFAGIKIITLTGLIILGIVLFFGGGPDQHHVLGFHYWKVYPFRQFFYTGNDGETVEVPGATGRFCAFWRAVIKSGFAFICSPELIAAAGGECEKPRHNIPKAARRFIYRLVFFYCFGTLVIGVICDSKDPRLMGGSSDASASPFVLGIMNAGIPVLNHIINAAILTSAASAGNSFLFTASRTMYSLADRGLAPKIFTKVNRWGIPYFAVAVSSLFGFLSYLNVSNSSASAFNWFSNISTISGFISWIVVCFAYLRWKKAITYNGLDDRVTYRAKFTPWIAYWAIFWVSLITITNGFMTFFNFNGADFVAAYITFPIVVFLYVAHRLYTVFYLKEKRWLTPINEISCSKGLDLVEEEDANTPLPVAKNWIQKIWYWIA